jgi:hypothetical protein
VELQEGTIMFRVAVALITVGLLLTGGCVGADSELTKLLSGGAKLASNPSDPPIGDLTAGEWMAITANLPLLAAHFPELGLSDSWAAFPSLTLQQAEDLVAFLQQYNLWTFSDLEELLERIERGEVEVEVPESLIEFAGQFTGQRPVIG